MNASGLRRNFKNIMHNYSEAQVKVREATSNDPWGPSSTLMSEIADLTYNVVAFSEIMQMIWKRLNDHGRNWRHVYKALVLLEYLIKTGTEKVAQQCKENIFAIQTLKDFQYIEDNKDQGMNVREKAKQLVSLLKDDERLKNERARALKAKERFAQATAGIGNEAGFSTSYRMESFGSASVNGPSSSPPGETDATVEPRKLENARPQTAGEEELQLQLALAMSKEEADQEEQRRRSDDVRLQMAITESQEDFKKVQEDPPVLGKQPNALLDLLDMGAAASDSSFNSLRASQAVTDPWGMPFQQSRQPPVDPWGSPTNNRAASTSPVPSDPWAPKPGSRSHTPNPNIANRNPWNHAEAAGPVPTAGAVSADPWGASASAPGNNATGGADAAAFGSTPSLSTNGDVDGFDMLSSRANPSKSTNNLDYLAGGSGVNPFDADGNPQNVPKVSLQIGAKKTPETFLGENSALVNLDALVSSKPPEQVAGTTTNPFASTAPNPFQLQQQQQQQQQRVSINQLRSQQQFSSPPPMLNPPSLNYSNLNSTLPPPIVPTGAASGQATNNPFL